jgi:hypothetical protein
MRTVLTHLADRGAPPARQRRCWPLAITGLALLAASVVMMAVGAQPSRAQTARSHLAPTRLAPLRLTPLRLASLRLPALTGRYQVGTVALHLIDRSRPDPWVASPPYRELMISAFYPAQDFDKFLRHGGGHLLDGPSPRYPDVTFVR